MSTKECVDVAIIGSGELETFLPRFFAIGDGAGVTRGLAQAGASGVKVARAIAQRLKGPARP